MDFLLNTLRQKYVYFTLISGFVLFCVLCFVLQTKSEGFLFLHNVSHSKLLLNLFNIISFLGNGYFAVIISLVFIFNSNTTQIGLRLLFAYILSGLLAQLFKKLFQLPRPKEYLHNLNIKLNLQDAHAGFTSFPSGHATTAFALATVLCLVFKNKKIQVPIFFIALLVCYSRIYLAHHFLEDVLAGCILGTLTGIFTIYIFEQNKQQVIYKRVKNKKK